MSRRARSCWLAAPRLAALLFGLACGACGEPAALTVDMPLHLEDHLADAQVTGSVAPGTAETVEWRFDEPQPGWKAARPPNPNIGLATLELTGDALRIELTEPPRRPIGGVSIEVPSWSADAWGDVVVRVRSDNTVNEVSVRVDGVDAGGPPGAFGTNLPLVRDGTVQTYRLPWPDGATSRSLPVRQWEAAGREVHQLGIVFSAEGGPGSVDLLSVSVAPIGEQFRDPPSGVHQVTHRGRSRRTLYVHAPSRLAYRVKVPDGGRLDYGLQVLREDQPVTFRVTVEPPHGNVQTLAEEVVSETSSWLQHSVDLSGLAGQTVTLVLETEAANPGTIALWGAPTVSGSAAQTKPNVIFYVIDGGGADQMSLYGYNRLTTPHLERLAQEGAVFEWAYSNSSWSAPSTPSFMTLLQNSVLEGHAGLFNPLPDEVRTMAERFHDAGYQTGVFTSNPWAGSASSLERGVDAFRDARVDVNSRSSEELHRAFWEWRETYPGAPYWVHFQTTDVHGPRVPQPPFAGLFSPPRTAQAIGDDPARELDAERAIYDETMAHQDYQLGRLVERLKESGEWENTLLVIAADHSIEAIADDFISQVVDDRDPTSPWVLLRSSVSHVPLVFIWPARIPGGQRLRQRVSMIDVLPTMLDLAGLPQPEVFQGQSLAPLLLGRDGWEPRPVILDEFDTEPSTGKIRGHIEVIDGRWGASLQIDEQRFDTDPGSAQLRLYDVDEDPLALHVVNDVHPDLVAKYTEFLTRQFEAHRLLAKRFTPGETIELTAEQLQTLRTLGYIS